MTEHEGINRCKICGTAIDHVKTHNNTAVPIEFERVTVLDSGGILRRGSIVHHGRCRKVVNEKLLKK